MTVGKNRGIAAVLAGLTLFGSLMVSAAFAAPPKKKPPTKKPPVKKDTKALLAAGKKVYNANGCKGCHTIGGDGGTNGPNLSKTGADAKHTVKWFEEKVKNPKASNPDSLMPPFEDKIKGKDLTALATYLTSLKK